MKTKFWATQCALQEKKSNETKNFFVSLWVEWLLTASVQTAEGGHWLVGLSNNLFWESFTWRANSLGQSLASFSSFQYEHNGKTRSRVLLRWGKARKIWWPGLSITSCRWEAICLWKSHCRRTSARDLLRLCDWLIMDHIDKLRKHSIGLCAEWERGMVSLFFTSTDTQFINTFC